MRRWGWVLAWVVAVLAPRCARAQVQMAGTDCTVHGVKIELGAYVLQDSLLTVEVIRHEAQHVLQIARFPSCEAAREHYTASQRNAALDEVEAYCASTPWAVQRAGGDRVRVFSDQVRYVLKASGRFPAGDGSPDSPPLTPGEVTDMFRAACPREMP